MNTDLGDQVLGALNDIFTSQSGQFRWWHNWEWLVSLCVSNSVGILENKLSLERLHLTISALFRLPKLLRLRMNLNSIWQSDTRIRSSDITSNLFSKSSNPIVECGAITFQIARLFSWSKVNHWYRQIRVRKYGNSRSCEPILSQYSFADRECSSWGWSSEMSWWFLGFQG